MSSKKLGSACELCGAGEPLTFHHLIPRTCHRNKWFRKHFELQDMRERGITICRACHAFVHRQFSEKALGRDLNTLEALSAEPVIADYVQWAKRRQRSH